MIPRAGNPVGSVPAWVCPRVNPRDEFLIDKMNCMNLQSVCSLRCLRQTRASQSRKARMAILAAGVAAWCGIGMADEARWICYPGDLGVYLGETVQARRPEWNGYTPVMWPQYHHWTVVEFAKEVDLAEPEEV